MLPIEMPLQRVDNSFDLNDSKMGKSVASGNLQGKGKFSEVFEYASSEIEKKQKSDMKQKIKPAVSNKEGIRKEINVSGKTSNQLKIKNEKLIGLKKIGPDSSKVRMEKKENSRKFRKDVSGIVSKVETAELEKNSSEKILFENPGEDAVSHSETPEIVPESLQAYGSFNLSAETSDLDNAEQLNSSVLLKSIKSEKNRLSGKKNFIKKDSKSSKTKISVLDLRQTALRNSKVRQADLRIESENKSFLSGAADQINSDNNEEAKPIVIELTHVKDNFSSESKTLTTSSSSALMKQLEENVNSKIVKQSSVILKDGGSGEIKLILKPEQLGRVRIRLSLTDNRIVGQIIVDSSAVKEVFEQNLQNLERAFKESGFDTASLNVSVGGGYSGDRERESDRGISKQMELIDEIIPTMISETENLIDLVV